MTRLRMVKYYNFNLKEIRNSLDLSLRKLAKKLGCDYTYIWHLENDKDATMNEKMYNKLMSLK